MKPDNNLPNSPELEARIVAWVLGEASAFEIAELERCIAEDPSLAVFKRRIEAVHGLVGAASSPEAKTLRMSPEKRAKLLVAMGANVAGFAEPGSGSATPATATNDGSVAVYPLQGRRTRIPVWAFSVAACLLVGLFVAYESSTNFDNATFVRMAKLSKDKAIADHRFTDADRGQPVALPQAKMAMQSPAEAVEVAAKRQDAGAAGIAQRSAKERDDSWSKSGAITADESSEIRHLPAITVVGEREGYAAGALGSNARVVIPAKDFLPFGPITAETLGSTAGNSSRPVLDGPADVRLNSKVYSTGSIASGQGALTFSSAADKVSGAADAGNAPVGGAAPAKIEPEDIQKLEAYVVSANREGSAAAIAGSRRADLRPKNPYTSDVTFSDQLADTAPVSFPASVPKQVANLQLNGGGAVMSASPAPKTSGFVAGLTTTYPAGAAGEAFARVSTKPADAKSETSAESWAASRAGNEQSRLAKANVASATIGSTVAVNDVVASNIGAGQDVVKLDSFEVKSESDRRFWSFGRRKAAVPAEKKVAVRNPASMPPTAGKVVGESQSFVAQNASEEVDLPVTHPAVPTDEMLRMETSAQEQPTSTFSLHVSDVSFRLAQAALERGQLPEPGAIRPEEFYNAFDYGDPAAVAGEPVACRVDQAAHPFLQQRNLVRIGLKVPAAGRAGGQPLNLTVLLDTSGSMEREDRVATVRRAFSVLASLLGPNDRITLIGFARQPRLLAERLPGNEAAKLTDILTRTPAEGGTNLEEALKLASKQAMAQFTAEAQNRIVVLTDGAANLGEDNPIQLAAQVEALRQNGIAFDACGIGIAGLDDSVLEALTRQGDGRYYVINSPEEADAGFAQKLAGAFRPAADNVKVQVRFNPARVRSYRLIGFEQHRLKNEDFRNDQVDAAELAAEEGAVALYQVELKPEGDGELGDVFIRFRSPATHAMVERSWTLTYVAQPAAFDQASPSLQLAGAAAMLAEKLRGGGPASQIHLTDLASAMTRLRSAYANQPRVQEFVRMYEQARRQLNE
jgi:secreted protein with Ig-like and vWFA domain